MRRIMTVAMALAIVAATAGTSSAYVGSLDPSFSGDGVVDLGRAESAVVAARGSGVVVAAQSYNRQGAVITVRAFTAGGEPQTSFSSDGIVTITRSSAFLADIAVDSHRRVLLLLGQRRSEVLRFTADGQIDRAFGDNGHATFAGRSETPTALALDSTGRAVVSLTTFDFGRRFHTDSAIVRLRPGGTVDREFGREGILRIDLDNKDYYPAVSVDDFDRPVLGGGSLMGRAPARVIRLTEAHGRFDTTFSANGIANIRMGKAGVFVTTLRAEPAIRVGVVRMDDKRAAAFGLTGGGALDTSFGTAGRVNFPAVDKQAIAPSAIDDSGEVIATGMQRVDPSTSLPVVAGRLSSGLPDEGIGVDGSVNLAVGTGRAEAQHTVLVGGRIITLVNSTVTTKNGSHGEFQLVGLGGAG